MLANGVHDNRKKAAILLSTTGDAAYELLQDLCLPDKPNTKSFDQLVMKLKEHLQLRPTVIAESYKFYQRNQEKGESIADYIACITMIGMRLQ